MKKYIKASDVAVGNKVVAYIRGERYTLSDLCDWAVDRLNNRPGYEYDDLEDFANAVVDEVENKIDRYLDDREFDYIFDKAIASVE